MKLEALLIYLYDLALGFIIVTALIILIENNFDSDSPKTYIFWLRKCPIDNKYIVKWFIIDDFLDLAIDINKDFRLPSFVFSVAHLKFEVLSELYLLIYQILEPFRFDIIVAFVKSFWLSY